MGCVTIAVSGSYPRKPRPGNRARQGQGAACLHRRQTRRASQKRHPRLGSKSMPTAHPAQLSRPTQSLRQRRHPGFQTGWRRSSRQSRPHVPPQGLSQTVPQRRPCHRQRPPLRVLPPQLAARSQATYQVQADPKRALAQIGRPVALPPHPSILGCQRLIRHAA